MTSDTGNDKPGSDKPSLGGTDQRPHATLDLKAKEIFTGAPQPQPTPTQTASPPPGAAPRPEIGIGIGAPPPPAETAAKEPSREGGSGGFFTNMAAGLIGAVLALTAAYMVGAARESERSEAQNRAMASVQQRLAAVENSTRTAVNEGGSIDARLQTVIDQTTAAKQEITTLGARLDELESRPAPGPAIASPAIAEDQLQPLAAKIADLETRIAGIAKAQDAMRAGAGAAAVTMAVQNLRRAVAEGKPFSAELNTLASLTAEPLELAQLEGRRDRGLASLAKLRQEFDSAARTAVDAARPAGDGSFTGGLIAKARDLVRVRPTGDIAGDTAEAILARAEQRLGSGDLGAAIREAGLLNGPAAEAMTPWLTEAKASAAADEALAKLESRLMTSLGSDERAKRGG